MFKFFKRFVGSANSRILSKSEYLVRQINALEPEISALTDDELRAKTDVFKKRVQQGETLDDLLVEAFAVVREAAKRVLNERPYDVQLMGGIILHKGMIAEMRTGEGKTLVSTLPTYLNALSGKGVHVVTVNDYLAQRDAGWVGRVHEFLGMTVGCIVNDLDDDQRREAYAADITWATNNELGFDYLRDNMKFRLDEMVQRPFNFALIDEMDSILIDEARTPLIISGPSEKSSALYEIADQIVRQLDKTDYDIDEKQNNATLTESGMENVEKLLRDAGILKTDSLYDIQNIDLVHHVNQALKAQKLYHKDKDYIVKDGQVILIDEFTGRMMDGRRFSEGLHQALEAKEKVKIQRENQTLATVTFQNFFRMYPKLAGMSGTALTEAAEFMDIYGLDVVELPTHVPCVRKDQDDEVYRTEREKFNAIIKLVKECRERNQPVLIGTASIEKSEKLSAEFKRQKIEHKVLNARYHDKEASIIAEAGAPGAVTIATNMAGRGTDIKLGGNLEARLQSMFPGTAPSEKEIQQVKDQILKDQALVKEAGGLYVVGTERHESRRIDNQLRGRSGRQGDNGASKFFLSLEDDLMRIFGSERLETMLVKLGLEEGEAITHPWINKAIQRAQQKVEARNFDIRKHLLKYDDVMNHQRQAIYGQRKEIMQSDDVSETVDDMRATVIYNLVARHVPPKSYPDQWDLDGLYEECRTLFGLELPIQAWGKENGVGDAEIRDRIQSAVDAWLRAKIENVPKEIVRMIEKSVLLRTLDQAWKDHLLSLDHLRQGINLRAYGQRDPLNEYKREAFVLFEDMLERLRERVTSILCQFNFNPPAGADELEPDAPVEMHLHHGDESAQRSVGRKAAEVMDPKDPNTWGRVPRNSACPCGSGDKYKNCHGKF